MAAVAQVGTLVTFVAGQTAVSGDVNQNFADIKTVLNNLITGANAIAIDTIAENTAAAGVTIDSVLLKDGSFTVTSGTVTNSASNVSLTVANTGTGGRSWRWIATLGADTLAGGFGLFDNTASTFRLAVTPAGEFDFQANAITTTGTLTAGVGAGSFTGTDQTGIAVTAAGIHAALVNLGLITA